MEEPKQLRSLIADEQEAVQKRWDQMTVEEQEEYQKQKQRTDDAYNNAAGNLNARYRNPSRFVTKYKRTHTKNVYKALFKKKIKEE